MTGTKLSDLAAITLAADADLLHVVNDTSGTPTNKKITVENLRNTNTINVLSYGADRTGVYDSTSSIQAAITAAAATVTLGAGAETGTEGVNWGPSIVYLPAGTYQITSTLLIPNGVGLCGAGARSTNLRVHSDWGADTIFIDCENGGVGVASYHQRFDHLGITLSDNSTITTGIRTDAWQENSGMYDVVMRQIHQNCTGLLVQTGTGGSARLGRMEDLTFFGDPSNKSVAAMHFNSPTGLLVNLQNCTIIYFEDGVKAASSTRLAMNSCHFESCTDCVELSGTASVYANTVRSHSTNTNVFNFSTTNNRGVLNMCYADGATALIIDASSTILGDFNVEQFHYPNEVTFTDDATPSMTKGAPVVNLAGSTTITDFDDTFNGQTFMVHFNSSMTVDFSGTNLRGNAGADLSAVFGDFMWVTVRGGNKYCLIGDSTV